MKKGGREEVFELGLERTALLKSIPETASTRNTHGASTSLAAHLVAVEIEGINRRDLPSTPRQRPGRRQETRSDLHAGMDRPLRPRVGDSDAVETRWRHR